MCVGATIEGFLLGIFMRYYLTDYELRSVRFNFAISLEISLIVIP